jgi:hypothetical protein
MYLQSLRDQTAECLPDALAMLRGEEELDPIYLLDTLAVAGMIGLDVPDTRTDTGRSILARAVDGLYLGVMIQPHEDEVDQTSCVTQIAEMLCLSAYLAPGTLAEFEAVNCAQVERHAGQWHPSTAKVAKFLQDIVTVQEPQKFLAAFARS